MKKTVLFLVSGTLSLFVFVACGSSSKADEKAVDNAVNQLNSAAQSTNSTSSSTETSTETTTSDASASTSTSSSSSSTEDWDAILNDYEEYVNQYIKFMKAAQKGDASAMSEYPAMLEKANSLNSKLTSGQGTMSSAQASRLLKIQNKMASAAAGM
ncbi:MAG: hypothetical protein FJX90_05925 [Bacteroidetes bacterium]|nr:hypothetical protein [Bacteroidota bacterium]